MTFRLWLRRAAQERLTMLRRFHLGAGKRSARREEPLPDPTADRLARALLAPAPTPGQLLAGRERARRVREAVAELAASDRAILTLRNLDALSNAEAAAALGIDPATASRRYGRALLRLRDVLTARGLTGSQP
jgi:RNA polymerase sigma-70 factor, ECF subfamily